MAYSARACRGSGIGPSRSMASAYPGSRPANALWRAGAAGGLARARTGYVVDMRAGAFMTVALVLLCAALPAAANVKRSKDHDAGITFRLNGTHLSMRL